MITNLSYQSEILQNPLGIYFCLTLRLSFDMLTSKSQHPTDGSELPQPQVSWVWHYTVSNGEAFILEHWGMWSTLSLSLLPGPLWSWLVVSVRFLSMSQIELLFLVLWNLAAVWKLFTWDWNKGVAPYPTPQCSSYWKGSLLVALNYGCPRLQWQLLDK